MDDHPFDRLVALLFVAGTRRALLGRIAALLLGGLLAGLVGEERAASRRSARQRNEVTDERKKRKRKKKCKPESQTQTCAGTCGMVQNNCKKAVDCGLGACGGGDICCNGSCCDGCCGRDGSCGACLVFATSSTHDGDLGGLNGADAICQNLAENAPIPLPGRYKAWLSTGTGPDESPATRFRQSGRRYERVDGVSVADNFADLTDGTINHPIILTEDASIEPLNNYYVWSNTGADGAENSDLSPPDDCNNWTNPTDDFLGRVGMADPIVTDEGWTNLSSVLPCDNSFRRFYCFQQE